MQNPSSATTRDLKTPLRQPHAPPKHPLFQFQSSALNFFGSIDVLSLLLTPASPSNHVESTIFLKEEWHVIPSCRHNRFNAKSNCTHNLASHIALTTHLSETKCCGSYTNHQYTVLSVTLSSFFPT